LAPAIPKATIIHSPELTRRPFSEFPQAPDNETLNETTLLRDDTNATKPRQQSQTSFTF
jgi:hypothetical protein